MSESDFPDRWIRNFENDTTTGTITAAGLNVSNAAGVIDFQGATSGGITYTDATPLIITEGSTEEARFENGTLKLNTIGTGIVPDKLDVNGKVEIAPVNNMTDGVYAFVIDAAAAPIIAGGAMLFQIDTEDSGRGIILDGQIRHVADGNATRRGTFFRTQPLTTGTRTGGVHEFTALQYLGYDISDVSTNNLTDTSIGLDIDAGSYLTIGGSGTKTVTIKGMNLERGNMLDAFNVANTTAIGIDMSNWGGSDTNLDIEYAILTGGGTISHKADDAKILWGAGEDASISYDGTDFNINPKEVGTGVLDVQGDLEISDATGLIDFTGATSGEFRVQSTKPLIFTDGTTERMRLENDTLKIGHTNASDGGTVLDIDGVTEIDITDELGDGDFGLIIDVDASPFAIGGAMGFTATNTGDGVVIIQNGTVAIDNATQSIVEGTRMNFSEATSSRTSGAHTWTGYNLLTHQVIYLDNASISDEIIGIDLNMSQLISIASSGTQSYSVKAIDISRNATFDSIGNATTSVIGIDMSNWAQSDTNLDTEYTMLTNGGTISHKADNAKIFRGAGEDASDYYDGTNFILDPDEVGTGRVYIGATGDDDMLLNTIEIDGDINHDGTNVGFYAVAPVARPAAYTQTYSTTTRTHSNLTSSTLTDSTGGTANTTAVAISGTGDDANINNNFF